MLRLRGATAPVIQTPTNDVTLPPSTVTVAPLTAFGWTVGSKLPLRYALIAPETDRYDLVFEDIDNRQKAPFQTVEVHCLNDRTIYFILASIDSNGPFADVLGALDVKYGQGTAGDATAGANYRWKIGDGVIELWTGNGYYDTMLSYGSEPLEEQHRKEAKAKQQAAGAAFASHL